MSFKELFKKFVFEYPVEREKFYKKNNKAMSVHDEYYKSIESEVRKLFKPYLEKYQYKLGGIGAEGRLNFNAVSVAHTNILADKHVTSKGFYVTVGPDKNDEKFVLRYGVATKNPPGDALKDKILALVNTKFSDKKLKDLDDPIFIYSIDDFNEEQFQKEIDIILVSLR